MKYVLIVFILIFSLQAKEKTLEERLAIAKRNSAIAEKKAPAFQENFGKKDRKNIEYLEAKYPKTSSELAIATCRAIKSMDWDVLYSYTVDDLHEELGQSIKRIEKDKAQYKKNFTSITCKIESSKKIGKFQMKYYFDSLGTIEIDFLDGWQVTKF